MTSRAPATIAFALFRKEDAGSVRYYRIELTEGDDLSGPSARFPCVYRKTWGVVGGWRRTTEKGYYNRGDMDAQFTLDYANRLERGYVEVASRGGYHPARSEASHQPTCIDRPGLTDTFQPKVFAWFPSGAHIRNLSDPAEAREHGGAIWLPAPLRSNQEVAVITAGGPGGAALLPERALGKPYLCLGRTTQASWCCGSQLAIGEFLYDSEITGYVHDLWSPLWLEAPTFWTKPSAAAPTHSAVGRATHWFEPLRLAGVLVVGSLPFAAWVDRDNRLRAWERLEALTEPPEPRFLSYRSWRVSIGVAREGGTTKSFKPEMPFDLDWVRFQVAERTHTHEARTLV